MLLFLMGFVKYRTIINPLASYSTLYIFGLALISSISCFQEVINDKNMIKLLTFVNICATFVAFSFLIAFAGSSKKSLKVYKVVLEKLCRNSANRLVRFRIFPLIFSSLIFLCGFFLMAKFGGGGMRWFSDPRGAYLENRAGVGILYAGIQILICLIFMQYLLPGKPKKDISILLACFFASSVAYFTGSKNNIIAICIIGLLYRNFFSKRLKTTPLVLVLSLMILLFIFHLIHLSGFTENLSIFAYFKEYTYTTMMFFEKVWPQEKLKYGSLFIDSFWYYVPRRIYPDKPYEYGVLRVHENLFPNMAERGHTPGIHGWVESFWDFGFLGLFLFGYIGGCISRCAYEFYIQNSKNRIAFIVMIQMAIWPIFTFATIPILAMVVLYLSFVERIRIS